MITWLLRLFTRQRLVAQPVSKHDHTFQVASSRYVELERRHQLLLDEEAAQHAGLTKGH